MDPASPSASATGVPILVAGKTLGPYRIIARVEAVDMGEVYRARDTRLGRDVVVKMLPQHLGLSGDVRALIVIRKVQEGDIWMQTLK